MVTYRCINKHRDKNGKILFYEIKELKYDAKGLTQQHHTFVPVDKLKAAIKENRVEVINLQLTSDNRLIDKPEPEYLRLTKEQMAEKLGLKIIPGRLDDTLKICTLESNCRAKDIKVHISLNEYDTGDGINYTILIQASSDKIKDRNISWGTAWRIDEQIGIEPSLGKDEYEHRIAMARSITSKLLNPQGYDDILFIYFLGKINHHINLYRFSVDELNDLAELYGLKRGEILKYLAAKNKSYAKENKDKLKEEVKNYDKNSFDRQANIARAISMFNIMTNGTIQNNSTAYKSMLKDFYTISIDFIKAINHYK